MKKHLIFVLLGLCLALTGCSKNKQVKPSGPQIIDWQGSALGAEIPEWVLQHAMGNFAECDKALGTPCEYYQKQGSNLTELKESADKYFTTSEVMAKYWLLLDDGNGNKNYYYYIAVKK